MASTAVLQVELVAADRIVWSGAASRVLARTAEGDLGVLAHHAPLLSLLVPGVVEIEQPDSTVLKAAVGDGFLSVADNRVSILSEDGFLGSEIDAAAAQAELDAALAAGDAAAAARADAKVRAADKAR